MSLMAMKSCQHSGPPPSRLLVNCRVKKQQSIFLASVEADSANKEYSLRSAAALVFSEFTALVLLWPPKVDTSVTGLPPATRLGRRARQPTARETLGTLPASQCHYYYCYDYDDDDK